MILNVRLLVRTALAVGCAALAIPAHAQEGQSAGDLAKQLSNPIASLISLPIQSNLDFGIGPRDGTKWTTNVQPVVPISLNADWNVISRTILPVISQHDVTGPDESQFGLGDVVQSVFFSPKEVGESGIIWGAGPVLLIPTATKEAFQSKKFGVGPTFVLLKQSHGFTVGLLANHIWSIAGKSSARDVSATFVQPFLNYTTPKAVTFSLLTETSYDWEGDNWVIPLIANVSKLTMMGKQPVSIGLGVKYYAERPVGGPDWGVRATFTLLFPKG